MKKDSLFAVVKLWAVAERPAAISLDSSCWMSHRTKLSIKSLKWHSHSVSVSLGDGLIMKPAAVTLPGPAVLVINYLSIYISISVPVYWHGLSVWEYLIKQRLKISIITKNGGGGGGGGESVILTSPPPPPASQPNQPATESVFTDCIHDQEKVSLTETDYR